MEELLKLLFEKERPYLVSSMTCKTGLKTALIHHGVFSEEETEDIFGSNTENEKADKVLCQLKRCLVASKGRKLKPFLDALSLDCQEHVVQQLTMSLMKADLGHYMGDNSSLDVFSPIQHKPISRAKRARKRRKRYKSRCGLVMWLKECWSAMNGGVRVAGLAVFSVLYYSSYLYAYDTLLTLLFALIIPLNCMKCLWDLLGNTRKCHSGDAQISRVSCSNETTVVNNLLTYINYSVKIGVQENHLIRTVASFYKVEEILDAIDTLWRTCSVSNPRPTWKENSPDSDMTSEFASTLVKAFKDYFKTSCGKVPRFAASDIDRLPFNSDIQPRDPCDHFYNIILVDRNSEFAMLSKHETLSLKERAHHIDRLVNKVEKAKACGAGKEVKEVKGGQSATEINRRDCNRHIGVVTIVKNQHDFINNSGEFTFQRQQIRRQKRKMNRKEMQKEVRKR